MRVGAEGGEEDREKARGGGLSGWFKRERGVL